MFHYGSPCPKCGETEQWVFAPSSGREEDYRILCDGVIRDAQKRTRCDISVEAPSLEEASAAWEALKRPVSA